MEQVAVRAWGNSNAIRLPKHILDDLGITTQDVLDINVEGDTIMLKKAFRHKSFKERLAEYDGKIEVYDFDWGEPVGREML